MISIFSIWWNFPTNYSDITLFFFLSLHTLAGQSGWQRVIFYQTKSHSSCTCLLASKSFMWNNVFFCWKKSKKKERKIELNSVFLSIGRYRLCVYAIESWSHKTIGVCVCVHAHNSCIATLTFFFTLLVLQQLQFIKCMCFKWTVRVYVSRTHTHWV